MKGSLAAGRYAKALINFSDNNNVLEKVFDEMKIISKVFFENNKISNLFKNPIISTIKKKKIIFEILGKHTNETKKVVNLLEKNKRLFMLYEISNSFISFYKIKKGISVAKITTVVELSRELESKILDKLKTFKKGKIKIENIINPNLLGGFIINFRGLQYDASIKNKFKLLKSQIVK